MRCFFTFQYISCYSLSEMRKETDGSGKHVSIHLMLLFILTTEIAEMAIDLFQYISCYSLSGIFQVSLVRGTWVSIHLMLLFILMEDGISPDYSCFNTSHVTLYRLLLTAMLKRQCSFNTSHVTLYLHCQNNSCHIH